MSAPSNDRAAIRQVIRALKAAGYELDYVSDQEEGVFVKTETEAIEAIMAVDDAILYVFRGEEPNRWVRFVMGNDPEEVAADWTVSLSPVLDPLTEGWGS